MEELNTTRFLEENIGVNLCDLGLNNGSLDITPDKKSYEVNIIKI